MRVYDTAQAAIDAAKFQRPGIRVLCGADAGCDAAVEPLGMYDMRALPGPASWLEHDLGYEPSLWAVSFGMALSRINGRPLTETVPMFIDPRMSLAEAKEIVSKAMGE